jgi:hypothetical protein
MRIENRDYVNAPASEVYRLLKDSLPKIAPYLPNVSRIDVMQRSESGRGTQIVNHWFALGEIPEIAKKVISPDLLSWKDTAVWNDAELKVDFRLESFVMNQLFKVTGTNFIVPAGENRTEVRVVCELELYPERVPGIPRFIASKFKPLAEEHIAKMVAPNLNSLTVGLNRYFAVASSL